MKVMVVIFCILASCSGIRNSNELSHNTNFEDFYQIDVESIENKKEIKYLSNLVSDVEYIQLETTQECVISPSAKYLFTESTIK